MFSSILEKLGYIAKPGFCTALVIYSNDMKQILVLVSGVQNVLQIFEDLLLKETKHFQLTICPVSSGLVNKGPMYNKYPYINIAPENASRLIYRMKRIVIL